MHADVTGMPSTAGELREWSAVSASRRLACDGRDLVPASDARRVPVVDGEGRFLGGRAATSDLRHLACRPLPADGRA